MLLLTSELRKNFPPLYSNEEKEARDTPVVVKFFDPTGSWTWYATEASAVIDGEYFPLSRTEKMLAARDIYEIDGKLVDDIIFFGLVDGFCKELGYFSLNELKSVKGSFGLGIERDRHFSGKMLSDVL